MLTERSPRQQLLGLEFDCLDLEETLARLRSVTPRSRFTYLVTPNVDHLVRLHSQAGAPGSEAVLAAYEGADLCVCDSRVLARMAGLLGVRVTVVPGSDVTARLFADVIEPGDRVAVIGGDEEMAAALRRSHPALDIVQHIPPMGLRRNAAAMEEAARFGASCRARFIFLAIGSPQQELLAHLIAQQAGASGCALCIGAAVEFVTGRQQRAPALLQRLSLEWSYRLLREPKRLWRRYLLDGPRILPLLIRWRLAQGRQR
jgi:N-acetylglucosaminyldiphosphoundecaprenol N-acetyl-beta-D-mannosaminyltransferase